MVTSNSGTETDAHDVFQEALIVIYKRAQSPDFVLTCPFYNFLYPVCKFIWLRKLNNPRRKWVTIEDENGYMDEANIEDVIHQTERHAFFKEKFEEIGEKCRQLIQLVLQKKKMREIAVLLGHKNEQTTKQQHYKCKKRLKSLIQEDPRYLEFKD